MSNQADNVKPAEEFVVYTDDSSRTPREDITNAAAAPSDGTALLLDTSAPPAPLNPVSRTDSFPKTLPLPAASILSPVSASRENAQHLPPLSEQQTAANIEEEDVISPPERASTDMLVRTTPLPQTDDTGSSTPLAELAGTVFDQQVAMRRRGDSILGEEISENVSKLNVDEEPQTVPKEIALPPREVFTPEELAARRNNPAVVANLPQTPSAEDFEVAKIQGGANFTPEFTETKVAS